MKIKSFLLITVFFSGCLTATETKHGKAFVFEKHYIPSEESSGVAVGILNCKPAVGTSSQTTDERFILLIRSQSGNVYSIDNAKIYGKVNVGDSILIEYHEVFFDGKVSDFEWLDANKIESDHSHN